MAKWKVTPSEGVKGIGPTFNFPKNITEDKEYVISYTGDSGCEAVYTYTVKACKCSLEANIPTDIKIDKTGDYEIPVKSYAGNFGIEGNEIRISASLPENSSNDEYIFINNITESTTPYGLYIVNYKVKKIPQDKDHKTTITVTNDCDGTPLRFNITVKAINTSTVTAECYTKTTVKSVNYPFSDARLQTQNSHIKIQSSSATEVVLVTEKFYKVDNTTPNTETVNLITKNTANEEVIYPITMKSTPLFKIDVQPKFTSNPAEDPCRTNNPTIVRINLSNCDLDENTLRENWANYMNELANTISDGFELKTEWHFIYPTTYGVGSTAYTASTTAAVIKEKLTNLTYNTYKNNPTILKLSPSDLCNGQTPLMPNATLSNNLTYCLQVHINIGSLPPSLYRKGDYDNWLYSERNVCGNNSKIYN